MDRCASCEREIASTWRFCIYCGRPVVAATSKQIREAIAETSDGDAEPRPRKYDGVFWVGVGMGALGLGLIIYAAVQIYGSTV